MKIQPQWVVTPGKQTYCYRYLLPDTNTHTHTHTQLYVHTTLFLSARTISVAGCVLAACLFASHRFHFAALTCTRNTVSVFIKLCCPDFKTSWLGGCAGQWRPPHLPPLLPLHTQVIRRAYSPSGGSRDPGRNGR